MRKDALTRALVASVLSSSLAIQRSTNIGAGRIPLADDDSAMDAYIEKLIRSVDEEDDEDGPNGDHCNKPNAMTENCRDNESGDASANEPLATKEESSKTVPGEAPPSPSASIKPKKTAKKKKTAGKKRKKPTTKGETSGFAGKRVHDPTPKMQHELEGDVPNLTEFGPKAEETIESLESPKPNPTKTSSAETRPRIPPPNGLYRFFLSKGVVGRLLVMFFILISELITLLIPSIGNLFRAVLPKPTYANPAARPTLSKRRESEITREADQAALQQLQKAGKEGGKYRLVVSSEFMKRHEIGNFSAEHSATSVDLDDGSLTSSDNVNDEEDEDTGWIVEALSSERQSDEHDDQAVSSSEFNASEPNSSKLRRTGKVYSERESRVRAAIKIPKKKLTKRNSFGSKLIEKFASTDNRFSRNLLGAYPGDAVPLEEAANAAGLPQLARKYGWGEWSNDAENGRRKRRRSSLHGSIDIGGSMDDINGF